MKVKVFERVENPAKEKGKLYIADDDQIVLCTENQKGETFMGVVLKVSNRFNIEKPDEADGDVIEFSAEYFRLFRFSIELSND